jgi:hypothetical protein
LDIALFDIALFRERLALVLFVYLFFCAGSALAEEPLEDLRSGGKIPFDRTSAQRGSALIPNPPVASFSTLAPLNPPLSLDLELHPQTGTLFGGEFRPRGKSLSDLAEAAASRDDDGARDYEGLPTLHATNGWQRLKDYKVRGGVRLLTLWQSKFSTLSLQAGHGGSPSLQWTSRGFGGPNSGAGTATHGLFDRLFSTTLGENLQHAGRSLTPPHLLHPTEGPTPER